MIPTPHLHSRNTTRGSGRTHRHPHQEWTIPQILLQLFPSLVLENLASIHDSLMRRLLLGLLDGTSPKSFHLTSDANTFQLTHIWGQEQSHVFQFKWELTKSSPDPLAKPLSSLLFFFSCQAGKKKKKKSVASSVSCLPYHSYHLLSKVSLWCWLWQVRSFLYPKA